MTNSKTTTAGEYFFDVATSVFDNYFQKLGACREASSSPSVIRYSTPTWFAEILYLPSDGPNYLPRVMIGCRPDRFVDPRRNSVDVMYTAPEGSEERDYNFRWRYKSSDDLSIALAAVRDRILDVYSLPFLRDSQRLLQLLEQRRAILDASWEDEINDHNDSIIRTDAEAAFKRKDYEAAIRFYDRIPPARRSKLDESRLQFAKSRQV